MIDYTLIRAKRRSITICIKAGAVVVKAPLKTDMGIIETFIASKSSWIRKKLRESERRMENLADVLRRENFLYLGERLYPYPSESRSFSIRENRLFIPKKYFTDGFLNKTETFFSALKKFYRNQAQKYLEERLSELSQDLDLTYTEFGLTNARTKWGSCDSKNRIRLNWHLIMLQKSLIDYVIIHELVHTVEHNHSRAFWNRVALHYPAYKEAIACLKEVGALIEL